MKSEDELRVERARKALPRLNRMHSLQDIEVSQGSIMSIFEVTDMIYSQDAARSVLTKRALAYYSSASDDLVCEQRVHLHAALN